VRHAEPTRPDDGSWERPHASRSVTLRLAGADDLPLIDEAFEREGWPQPMESFERYLAEQAAGLRLFLLAIVAGAFAGFLTLTWNADYDPFREEGIPEIQDLCVLPSFRRRAVATQLLAVAEKQAAERSDRVGLGVGLYAAYGPAHRLYATRGYHPVGEGATVGGRPLHGGETVFVDDNLVLHLVKRLRA
jgi:GNAT superfamily N-acetyltransferase